MAQLKWNGGEVAKLARTAIAAGEWSKEYGQRGKARPSLVLVKDQGIYLMCNRKYQGGDTPAKCGEVLYARGFDPDKVDFDEWWDAARNICGGDDFGEFIDLTEPYWTRVLAHSDEVLAQYTFVITMSETSMSMKFRRIVRRGARHA